MTPMIDVVFLLLIFFVCTASIQPLEQALRSDLVLSGAGVLDAEIEPQPEIEEVIVRGVWRADRVAWSVNDSPTPTLEQLRTMLIALAEIDPTLPVIVDADGPTPLGQVVAAYDMSRAAGFATVRFAASAE